MIVANTTIHMLFITKPAVYIIATYTISMVTACVEYSPLDSVVILDESHAGKSSLH